MVRFTRKPLAKKQPASQPRLDEVAKLAYELYLERGGGHGKDQEDWFQAETLLRKKKV